MPIPTRSLARLALALIACIGLGACATAPAQQSERDALVVSAEAAVARAKLADPSMATILGAADTYAVFPTIGKAAVAVGGAYGKGVLYENGALSGYCDLLQASIGLALGAQSYTEIIVFKSPEALEHFKAGGYAFDGQATAVAIRSGAGANARYTNGVAVFTMNEAGLMGEASIGGQKFSYKPK